MLTIEDGEQVLVSELHIKTSVKFPIATIKCMDENETNTACIWDTITLHVLGMS